ncbi:MAG: hypothetical protein IT298_05345 [Chloroflexi bacterium]|nr:hypothetical protein [Anaerolineae bacterium]MCC6565169.1 hypothetical protein [Chloroflexota bacterium]MCO6442716.1 hypothetical protein [Anaerolineae bacterium]MEB2364718.1 hypothetical protein [Chloroflexota bacterium]GIK29614.1 MAG: hypothetical protein BroJett007_27520 [Chloroflexota bacterium]
MALDGGERALSLLEYGRIVVQRGWIVVLCAALGACAMLFYSSRQDTVYRSTMQVIFEPAQSGQGISAANAALLRSYVVYLSSTGIAGEIVEELGMGISAEALKAGTEISAVPDQSLIRIEVNDANGDWANTVAYAWGLKLVDVRNRQNDELPVDEQIIATPHDFPRYTLYRPRTTANLLLGAVGGSVLGVVIIFVLERRRLRIVKSPGDFALGRLLATIPLPSAKE